MSLADLRAAGVAAGIAVLTLGGAAATEAPPDPAELKRLMQAYVAEPAPETYGKIRRMAEAGIIHLSLEYCLTRDNDQIRVDLPALQRDLEMFGSRGHINEAAGGKLVDVTFWGQGQETLARVHNVPEFTEYLSLTSFVDVRVQEMNGIEFVYCSVTSHSVDAPESTALAREIADRLSAYRSAPAHEVVDFQGSPHETSDGEWGAAAWAVKDGNTTSLFAVMAYEIGVSFEFHRIKEAQ